MAFRALPRVSAHWYSHYCVSDVEVCRQPSYRTLGNRLTLNHGRAERTQGTCDSEPGPIDINGSRARTHC